MRNFAYSSIQHLVHALFINQEPRHSHLMILLTAFFDASSSEIGNRIITVAGFVSTKAKWLRFEREWNEVLKRYGVPYLHMKEFAHSRGAFADWKGKESQRKEFLIALLKVAKKGVNKGFGHSVFLDDFEEVNQAFTLKESWGNAYSLVSMAAVTRALEWKNRHFPNDPILLIFESGDAGSHHLDRCLNLQGLEYAFIPKKVNRDGKAIYNVGFQIADFAAWENRAAILRMTEDPLKDLRQSFEALYKQIPAYFGISSREKLLAMGRAKKLHRKQTSVSHDSAVDNHPASQD